MRTVLRVKEGRRLTIETTFKVLIVSIAKTNMHAHSQMSRTDDRKNLEGHHKEKKVCRMRTKRQNGGVGTGREEEVKEKRVNMEPAEPEMVREIGV